MIIVSGVSRSGTSLMMDCLREALGEDRIVCRDLKKGTTPEEQCADYLKSLAPPDEDMNPNGFFEDMYAVAGMHYRLRDWKRLCDFRHSPNKIVKIVARGLIHTDPDFVDKVILMVRHPRCVAHSQRRLHRRLPLKEMYDEQVISPDFYIRVAIPMCVWLAQHKVPVYIVEYEKLVQKPLPTLKGLFSWLGEEGYKKASTRVDPKLSRSERAENSLPRWEWAEEIYSLMLKKDFATIAKMDLKPLSEYDCVRNGIRTNWDRCKMCVSNPRVSGNFRRVAESRGFPWQERPCLYECGFGPGPYVSIEDSIKNHSWR